jgi:hypothetical protein
MLTERQVYVMFIIVVLLAALLNLQSSAAQAPIQPSNERTVTVEAMPKLDDSKQDKMLYISPPALPLTELFAGTVNQWITELSKQKEFADWQSTTLQWDRQPLGPGLHGWIVIITDRGQELGYLVVSVDPDGNYRLSEYGHGEYPLFSENTLYRSLVQHELIDSSISFEQFLADSHMTRERIYLSPLQNIWLFTTGKESYQIDAKTGDLMSIDTQILEQIMKQETANHSWTAPTADTQQLQQSVQLPPFDPYFDLSWIIKPPSTIKDLQQLQASLNSGQLLTFVTDLYDDTVLYAFSVTGYHQWNAGDPFISIDQDGTRFIPAQLMMQTGRYYLTTYDPTDDTL